MSRFLLDVNVVLALLDPRHVFHTAAHRWVERAPEIRWLTCPLVQNGVIRVASQSAYPNAWGTAAEVCEVLRAFCEDARHEFCPDDISLLDSSGLVAPALLTPSRVSDVYLLALAWKHEACLATFDGRVPVEAVSHGAECLCVLEA